MSADEMRAQVRPSRKTRPSISAPSGMRSSVVPSPVSSSARRDRPHRAHVMATNITGPPGGHPLDAVPDARRNVWRLATGVVESGADGVELALGLVPAARWVGLQLLDG